MTSSPLRPVVEHQRVVAGLLRPRGPVSMSVSAAVGLVLAVDVPAPLSLPPFDNSAMDGYAVRAADVAGATDTEPVRLPVADDIPAGRRHLTPLAVGSAQRIMTGAPMPPGADAVVPVEVTDAGTETVSIRQPAPTGGHVRRAAEDIAEGQLALPAGTVVGAAQVGLLAALGIVTVSVVPAPRVLVLSTGSELVAPGGALAPGQIFESNAPMLLAAIRAAGAEAEVLSFVADDVAEFRARLDARLDDPTRPGVDLLVTTGGVSAGAYEVVKDALSGQGVEFVKVAMQPGMPQGSGHYRDLPIVTFPGNPVSALVSFEVFLRPALRSVMGHQSHVRPTLGARLAEGLSSPAGRRQFRRGHYDRALGTVTLVGPPASHFLRSLASSNCLLDIPEAVTRLEADQTVDVWLVD